MFIFHNNSELEEAFGVKAIETRGDRKGKIFKLPEYYFKVYDHPKKESTYIVQGYFYNSDVPFVEDDVPYTDIKRYAAFFIF